MKKIFSILVTIIFPLCLLSQTKESTSHKIALVVGVSSYEHASQLKNTLNDANDLAQKLELLGFRVRKLIDPDMKSFSTVVDSISKGLLASDQLLFYFSGHGAEFNGENYLFLKNSNPSIPNDMPYETYPLGRLLGKIEFSKIRTSIIILDACRSNPFARNWNKAISFNEGLANVNAPTGMFIGFAASPGKTASDGIKRNGTYTEGILKYIEIPNLTIDQIFNKVNKDVRIQSAGKQIPFKTSSLEDDYYFRVDYSLLKYESLHSNPEDTVTQISNVNRPKFPMPKNVKGYVNDKLNSYATVKINKTTFEKDEVIQLYFSLVGKNIWDKATPIYVDISERKTPSATYQQYAEQFEPQGKNTLIRLASSLKSGTYELSIGFYLINELNLEYPPYYSKKFNITIL